jgi:hypothetical protein
MWFCRGILQPILAFLLARDGERHRLQTVLLVVPVRGIDVDFRRNHPTGTTRLHDHENRESGAESSHGCISGSVAWLVDQHFVNE